MLYKNIKLTVNFITECIKKNKNHKKVLKDFIFVLEKIFFSNTIKIIGIKIRLSGKLNGSMRKSKYQFLLGTVQLQKININICFNLGVSYTQFGIISVKF